MTVRVVVADDQTVVRAGIRSLVDHDPGLEVVGEAADGDEAVSVCRRERPDVVLMDIRMPAGGGLHAARTIVTDPDLDAVRVLMLTTYDVDDLLFAALRDGAHGFLLKTAEPDLLRDAIHRLASGEAVLDPAVTSRVIDQFRRSPAEQPAMPRSTLDHLTERELDVLRLVAEGLTNVQIAERLVIAEATAKTHVNRAMAKLGVSDRAQLVVIAFRTGLVRDA